MALYLPTRFPVLSGACTTRGFALCGASYRARAKSGATVEDLVENVTSGHVTEVKIVLTSVVTALAFYQAGMMTVGWGKVHLPFLGPRVASEAHRTFGDVIVPITALVGAMCVAYFGFSEDHAREGQEWIVKLHVLAGYALAGVLAIKIVIVRWWRSLSRFLPAFGIAVLSLFVLTWITSAGAYL